MLKFELHRIIIKGASCTMGRLILNGNYLCDTLEPPSMGFSATSSLERIRNAKKRQKIAIPSGLYRLQMGFSPRFSPRPFYKACGGGLLPRVLSVPAFSGVLIHCGNTIRDTLGCVLVGRRADASTLVESQKTYSRLMRQFFEPASRDGETMYLEIFE